MEDLKIILITEPPSLYELKPEWDELLRDSNVKTVFLTWEWINSWWEVYGERYKLYIVTVRDPNDRLLAIAPFKIATKQFAKINRYSILQFIGTGEDVTSEHLDIIIRKGMEGEIIPLIGDYILKSRSYMVDLKPFSADSPNIPLIENVFKARKVIYEIREHSMCPFTNLPGTWNEFMGDQSRNFRKKMKEYSRRCRRDLNMRLIKCSSVEDVNKHMDLLIALNHKRWDGRSKAFMTKKYVDFHKKIAALLLEKDSLRLLFLMQGDKAIAGNYCLRYADEYFYYQSGRDPSYSRYNVGLVLMNMAIEEAINEKIRRFDFLTGNEAYKFRWAKDVKKNVRIICWRDRNKYIFSKLFYSGKKAIRRTATILRGNGPESSLSQEGSKRCP